MITAIYSWFHQKRKPEQNFILSHIEYGRTGLRDEYQREIAAHPNRHYKKPDNYSMSSPLFQWKDTHFLITGLNKLKKAS